MTRPFALLAALVALLVATAPGTAVASGKLRSTLAQATPTPAGEELSEDPGLPNGDDGSEEEESAGDEAAGDEGAGDLPNTGAEPLLVALMGLGLVGTGLGIRRRIAHAGPRA